MSKKDENICPLKNLYSNIHNIIIVFITAFDQVLFFNDSSQNTQGYVYKLWNMLACCPHLSNISFLKDWIYLFLEREGRGKERERET